MSEQSVTLKCGFQADSCPHETFVFARRILSQLSPSSISYVVKGGGRQAAETRADFEGFTAELIEVVDIEQFKGRNALRVGDSVATISRSTYRVPGYQRI
jgi:hypothetical protein